jgi:hypothetical protein
VTERRLSPRVSRLLLRRRGPEEVAGPERNARASECERLSIDGSF